MTTPTKTLLATGIATVVAGCSTNPLPKPVSIMPPVPVVKNVVRVQRMSAVVPITNQPMVWKILYPTNINASNYNWTVESSVNLITWTNEPSFRDGGDIVVTNTKLPFVAYRLSGTPH